MTCLDDAQHDPEPTPDLQFFWRIRDGAGSFDAIVDMGAYEACSYDCQTPEASDDNVGINDMLDLLAQWGTAGSCDVTGGGVGINDLLNLFAEWGPCTDPPMEGAVPETVEECIDKLGYEDLVALSECICAVEPESCEE